MTKKLTKITALHYVKLVFRSGLLITAAVIYIKNKHSIRYTTLPALIVWLIFMAEMIIKQFPVGIESMGCQKQFRKNYIPTNQKKNDIISEKRVATVAAAWIVLNLIIGGLYISGIIDKSILILISLAYAVSDMICVLFFCPFRKWLGNRCCVTCRIYNWDYAMMFTPLIFIRSVFLWSLVLAAAALLIRWEITAYIHPERFYEETNKALACENCKEKNCPKQLPKSKII